MLKSTIERLACGLISSAMIATNNNIDMAINKANSRTVLDSTIDERDKRYDQYIDQIAYCIDTTSSYKTHIEAVSLANDIERALVDLEADYNYKKDIPKVLAMMSAETDFRNLSANEAEAVGYMQITPECLEYMNKKMGWDYTMDDMNDPEANIKVGWAKLNLDMDKLSEDEAIVAYNQGYRNLKGAVIASWEDSHSYLSKIINREEKYSKMMGELKYD